MAYLALTLPGGQTITAPGSIPSGGMNVLSKVIANSINIFIIVCIILCLFSAVWAGVQWSASNGDKSKITAARARITWSIVGLVIVLLAFLIVNSVGYVFHVNLTK
jgi:hypothetical protein